MPAQDKKKLVKEVLVEAQDIEKKLETAEKQFQKVLKLSKNLGKKS
jgi:hypothetical protein